MSRAYRATVSIRALVCFSNVSVQKGPLLGIFPLKFLNMFFKNKVLSSHVVALAKIVYIWI